MHEFSTESSGTSPDPKRLNAGQVFFLHFNINRGETAEKLAFGVIFPF